MSLTLMYITKDPQIATIAENAGVDRIFLDMEYIGKEKRQANLDSVKSHHTVADIKKIRSTVKKSKVLVRVNPIHEATTDYCNSEDEIKAVLDSGADVIMLPMYRTMDEVELFLKAVDGRAITQLLAETPEACNMMSQITRIPEVDEIHIGLNDLHLACHKKFMFELLSEGTVDHICNQITQENKKFGFGGIARIGYGLLPAEYIIKEHYRLGSTCAILSRAFCNVDKMQNIEQINDLFKNEMCRIRQVEKEASTLNASSFEENRKQVIKIVQKIISEM